MKAWLIALAVVFSVGGASFPTLRTVVRDVRRDASHVYPKEAVAQFATGCTGTGVPGEHCTCVIGKLQDQYSYGDFQRLPSTTAQESAREASIDCAGRESHAYPEFMVKRFHGQCAGAGGTRVDFCGCIIARLQERYTVAEFIQIEQAIQPGQRVLEYELAADECMQERVLPPAADAG